MRITEGLSIVDGLPGEFFNLDPERMHTIFPNPTLIHIKGVSSRTVFVSTLLHGNETSGIKVLQEVFSRGGLEANVLLLIGNVEAAKNNLRRMPNQVDFNRVWSGPTLSQTHWAQAVLSEVRRVKPLAVVDIHNSTGRNPSYGVISYLEDKHIHLASEFSKNIVYSHEPRTTLVSTLGEQFPAVVLECGPSGDKEGIRLGTDFLHRLLNFRRIERKTSEVVLMESIARIFVTGDFGFGDQKRDLNFVSDLDLKNFVELPAGDIWGTIKNKDDFRVIGPEDRDRTAEYFSLDGGVIKVKASFIPSLISLSQTAVNQDCLCYVMRRI